MILYKKELRGEEMQICITYRSHHEIDSVIGHSLGGAVALPLEKQYEKEVNNPFGIVQSKTFGSPTVLGNISNPLLKT